MRTVLDTPHTSSPVACLLSNGDYHAMITNAGGGYARWRGFDVSRWRSDGTTDDVGRFVYLRDVDSGRIWSVAYHPTRTEPDAYQVEFHSDRARFTRADDGIETSFEVVVAPSDPAELWRVTLTNRSPTTRRVEVTSYAELALAPHVADRAHPVFSRLFIETQALKDQHALLAWRRLRSPDDTPVWSGHVLASDAAAGGPVQFETDRAKFLGRGRTAANPAALEGPLSGAEGYVLDPVFSLRRTVELAPGASARLLFATVVGADRQSVTDLIARYGRMATVDGAVAPASVAPVGPCTHAATAIAGRLLFLSPELRARLVAPTVRWPGGGPQGDRPIVLAYASEERAKELEGALTTCRERGVAADLVLLGGDPVGDSSGDDANGRTFRFGQGELAPDELTTLRAAAHVVLDLRDRTLAEALPLPVALSRAAESPAVAAGETAVLPPLGLLHHNGYGGFTPDGREYVIDLTAGKNTPRPWTNVLSNPRFGVLVTESGGGFTWAINSQSGRLTPWSNDPIADTAGDAIFLDEPESGAIWTPTALPIREPGPYRIRHGQGYSAFEHVSHELRQELTTFVPLEGEGGAPVRIQRLRLHNLSQRHRTIRATLYAEWVLGVDRELNQRDVATEWDADAQVLLACDRSSATLGGSVAFAACSGVVADYSADRTEVLGRNGGVDRPAGLRHTLSGQCGAGLDPCAALRTRLDLEPGGSAEVIFLLGVGDSCTEAVALAASLRDPNQVRRLLDETRRRWDEILGAIEVETPDSSVDLLLNRWLIYQSLACRFWGRSGFFQSGGAFGFRDQLQDSMGLTYALPELVRAHLLRCASRQFVEGDVQHWWHPDSGFGVRTRMTDDLLWLPYVTAHYIRVTGDAAVLDEVVPFVEGRHVRPEEHDAYFAPEPSKKSATLFEHCRLAIDRGATAGAHGLPLMGTGDWNDGMNLVGAGGKGESVWLAWFLIQVLNDFVELAETRAPDTAAAYRERAEKLAATIDAVAWDGAWYYRATYDDGTILGSHRSEEARIDSIAQSWAAITGAGLPDRAAKAMQSVNEYLVWDKDKLVVLFTPAFDSSPAQPGYIKGYPPGVRENGGQYTHGSLWSAMAWARLGNGAESVHLLNLMNPINHGAEPDTYLVEPYVVAADIYSMPGRVGMGGWTWYTGSASWMYRIWLEEVLGFKLRGDRFTLQPVLPPDWPGFKLRYRFRTSVYSVEVAQSPGSAGPWSACLDGETLAGWVVPLVDDGATHVVRFSR